MKIIQNFQLSNPLWQCWRCSSWRWWYESIYKKYVFIITLFSQFSTFRCYFSVMRFLSDPDENTKMSLHKRWYSFSLCNSYYLNISQVLFLMINCFLILFQLTIYFIRNDMRVSFALVICDLIRDVRLIWRSFCSFLCCLTVTKKFIKKWFFMDVYS